MRSDRENQYDTMIPERSQSPTSGMGRGYREVHEGRDPLIDRIRTQAPESDIPSLNGLPYVNPNNNSYASQTNANIYRADWEDYKARFAPYEQKLMDLVGNEQNRDSLLQNATDNVNQGFGIAQADFTNRMSNYGVTNNALQQQVNSKTNELSRTAALVGARNGVRTQFKDTENNILAGGLGDVLQYQQG